MLGLGLVQLHWDAVELSFCHLEIRWSVLSKLALLNEEGRELSITLHSDESMRRDTN